MSLDELRADLARNIKDARNVSDERTRGHLENTLWPFIEALVDVIEEIDDVCGELVDHTEDYLRPETAAVFATLAQSSIELSAELRKRTPGDAELAKRLDMHDALCTQAMTLLGQITMISEEDEEDEEEAPDA